MFLGNVLQRVSALESSDTECENLRDCAHFATNFDISPHVWTHCVERAECVEPCNIRGSDITRVRYIPFKTAVVGICSGCLCNNVVIIPPSCVCGGAE